METVFHTADGFFSALTGALRTSRHSITCESYIFEKDALGRRMLRELIRAAARGVSVRLVGESDIIARHGRALATLPFWRMVSYWI